MLLALQRGSPPRKKSSRQVSDLFEVRLVEPLLGVRPKMVAWGRVYLTVLCVLSIELFEPVILRPWGASESIPRPSNRG